jgi:hypothetical protein
MGSKATTWGYNRSKEVLEDWGGERRKELTDEVSTGMSGSTKDPRVVSGHELGQQGWVFSSHTCRGVGFRESVNIMKRGPRKLSGCSDWLGILAVRRKRWHEERYNEKTVGLVGLSGVGRMDCWC